MEKTITQGNKKNTILNNQSMYSCFDKYVLRTPLFSVNKYLELTSGDHVTDATYRYSFEDPIIKEAIYLASPDLYEEIKKWIAGEITDHKKIKKIKESFLKYLSRISSRSTPFGLFSGVCPGHFSSETTIILDTKRSRRSTRLDMNITGLLIQKLESEPEVKESIKYFPNNSLYEFNGQLRFIESHYRKKHLIHQLVEIENSSYIQEILGEAKKGLRKAELAEVIVDTEISLDEAKDFIEVLIESHVLTSELQQSVSGKESLEYIIDTLQKRIGDVETVKNLKKVQDLLVKLDRNNSNPIEDYERINHILSEMKIDFDKKHVFQTDLTLGHQNNNLSFETKQKIEQAFVVLNKISPKEMHPPLQEFIQKFEERYEQQEIPLTTVLDEEVGIGFPVRSAQSDFNSLLDDLLFPGNREKEKYKKKWSEFHSLLLKKVFELEKKEGYSVELTKNDIKDFSINSENLPDTMSTISQLVEIDGQNKFIIGAISGPGGANLLGRFCQSNEDISNLVKDIMDIEEKLQPGKILAEIVHLPKDRIGNILQRPMLRKYEIPYLARSNKKDEEQININDITVCIRNKRIVLRSIKHRKEVVPKLSTAHNFSSSTIPVYRFLCALQYNNKIPSIFFDWGPLESELNFFPRVYYGDLVLSTAKWKVANSEVKEISKCEIKERIQKMVEWREERKIPDKVYIIEGDNKLLINFKNSSSMDLFFGIIKKKKILIIEEFLFQENQVTQDCNGEQFANEFVFSFFKN